MMKCELKMPEDRNNEAPMLVIKAENEVEEYELEKFAHDNLMQFDACSAFKNILIDSSASS